MDNIRRESQLVTDPVCPRMLRRHSPFRGDIRGSRRPVTADRRSETLHDVINSAARHAVTAPVTGRHADAERWKVTGFPREWGGATRGRKLVEVSVIIVC